MTHTAYNCSVRIWNRQSWSWSQVEWSWS